jgi:hypothetical protein
VKDDKPAEISENINTSNQNESKDNYIENTTSNSIIEEMIKEAKIIEKINTFEELEPTSDAQLKAGSSYIYHLYDNPSLGNTIICDPVELDIVTYIDKIEKINGTNYYILRSDQRKLYPVCYVTKNDGSTEQIYLGKPQKPGDRDQPKKYGGCIIGVNKDDPANMTHIPIGENQAMCSVLANIRENWMLYLNEDTIFIQEADIEFRGQRIISITEFVVEGSEKINGISCFKVKRIRRSGTDKEHLRMESEDIYYIDKQRRITVNHESYAFYQGGRFLKRTSKLKEIKE